jgi:hypothetical protein
MLQGHGSILKRGMPIGHGEMPCVACFGEETEIRELILSDHLPLLFQRAPAPFFFKKGMGEKKSNKSNIDDQVK